MPHNNATPTDNVRKHRIGILACAALIALFSLFSLTSTWLFNSNGELIVSDFVSGWSAAKSLIGGESASDLYDWEWHSAAQQRHLGYGFEGAYGWQYPPYALFLILPLAFVSYGLGWFLWLCVTGSVFGYIMQRIAGHWAAIPLLLLFPASLWNMSAGQNGFLTAFLLGGAIWLLERRPIWAGVLLGLLSFKPQLGLIFPIVLIFEGRWRVFAAASITVLILASASLCVFGVSAWQAFFSALPVVSEKILYAGGAGFGKLHSIYGWVRLAGGGQSIAFVSQAVCALCAVVWVLWIRRHAVKREVSNAALALAPLFINPYIWVYDMTLIAVAFAFILRLIWREGALPYEREGMVMAAFLLALYPTVTLPWGFVSVTLLAGLLTYRVVRQGDVRPVDSSH